MMINFTLTNVSNCIGQFDIDVYEAVADISISIDGKQLFEEKMFPVLDLGLELSRWNEQEFWTYSPSFMNIAPVISIKRAGSLFVVESFFSKGSMATSEDIAHFIDGFLKSLETDFSYHFKDGTVRKLSKYNNKK